MREYIYIRLRDNYARRFRGYLMDMHIKFEPSDAGHGFTHFECLMDEHEIDEANAFINNMFKEVIG